MELAALFILSPSVLERTSFRNIISCNIIPFISLISAL